ncbi:MAG: hypothetical protein WD468_02160 [Pirellulales bacterium]
MFSGYIDCRLSLASMLGAVVLLLAGCQFVPQAAREPTIRNPFPQLSKVAVVEFFNGTTDDTVVDGLQFAVAYANELQTVQGYEVIPPDIVRGQMRELRLTPADLSDPGRRRLLANALGADAIVTGVVTEFSPYYPPRLGLQVDWYAASPCFHPIPPGYGLPWGTADEEEIPDSLVYEAELALAREQMKTQTPPGERPPADARPDSVPASAELDVASATSVDPARTAVERRRTEQRRVAAALIATRGKGGTDGADDIELPADWPDPRGFVPAAPQSVRPECIPSIQAVMSHTRIYHGHDVKFTAALRNYYYFRDEARFGGWQNYLQRSDDFIRFCCHLHLSEMLTARGGAGKSRLVWRWSEYR